MVTSRAGVEAFLAKRLDDCHRAKRLDDAELDRLIWRYRPDDLTDKYRHQKVGYLLARTFGSLMVLFEMGGGKTKLALDLHRDWGGRMLVPVPNVVNLAEWAEQAEIHSWDRSVALVEGANAADVLEGDAELVIVTYQGLAHFLREELVSARGKPYWGVDHRKAQKLAALFRVLCMDEISSIRKESSLWFRVCRALSHRIPHRLGLTGTPMDKLELDLWAPFYAVDHGATLGDSLGVYRDAYFRKEEGYWSDRWVFRRRMTKCLRRRLRHRSIEYAAEECQDMPRVNGGLKGRRPMVRSSSLPAETRAYHARLAAELKEAPRDLRVMESVYLRMRQISSGWLGLRSDLEKVEVRFADNPKLDDLLELLREVDQPTVVVYHFKPTGRIISEALSKAGLEHVRVWGELGASKKIRNLDRFKRGDVPYLVASSAVAYGVNLQSASRYMVFFESPDSVILRKQLESRVARGGGLVGTRHLYDLQVRGTADAPILRSLLEGRDAWDSIRSGRIDLRGLLAETGV